MRLETRRRDRIFELAARLEPTYTVNTAYAQRRVRRVRIIKRSRNREGEEEEDKE